MSQGIRQWFCSPPPRYTSRPKFMNTQENYWNQVLSVIQTKVSVANFQTLFKNTALISLENNTATIAVPSSIIIDMIQKRYNPLIKEELTKLTGTQTDILFVPKTVEAKKKQEKETPLFSQLQETKVVPQFAGHPPRVRPDFTFQNIAVSSSNQLAYISATTVAKNIGTTYNPLFIYGPTGVGKTHLMHAIANEVYHKDPAKKIVYITSEEFTNDVVEAIRSNQTHAMKKKFRSAYLLIIDDVQFIAGKDRVQEELFHTFNILIDNQAQIVLSSDRPPHEIKKLEKRLSSRFSGGLTVDVEPPDFELKTAILLIKAKKYGVELPIDVAKNLAEQVEDTRSLEGALLRLITQSANSGKEISLELMTKSRSVLREERSEHIHPDDVIKKVCEYYDIKTTQIKGPKRTSSLVKARQVAMFILKKELDLTYVDIGNMLGGRDHTTVMHGVEKMEEYVGNKAKVSEDIVGITRGLRD